MANNGVIKGDDVLLGVVERVKEVDSEFKKLLATYTALQKSVSNSSNLKGLNEVLKQKNATDQNQVKLLQQITKLEKEKANALAATERAAAAALRTEGVSLSNQSKLITLSNKKIATQRKEAGATRTNLSQLRNLNSFYAQQSRLLTNLRDRYKDLEARKQLGIKLTKLEQSEYSKLRSQVLALDASLKKTDAAAGQFQRNVGNYAKGTRVLVSSLRSLAGAFGFTSGIFIFASALKDSLARVRAFDKSMQNLAGVLGETRDQIAPIEKEVIKVAGASIKTSREVGELAESLATLGKKGQDLINLIKPANDLSIALQATSDEAAEFLVQTLNAFGEPSTSAEKFANTITAIRTSTSLDFEKMRDSFQYITPISKILNKDLAYTGAVVGLLADNGLKAESAGRLLGTALQKLGKEGRTLDSALEEINQAQRDGVEGYDLLALASNLFGKQAAKIGIILASNTGKVEENAEAIRNNGDAMEKLVEQQLESLDAKMKILDSTWEQLILTIENGEGSFSRFFKGAAIGVTGYLEELIKVEEAQSKVFQVTGASKGWFDYVKKFNPLLNQIGTSYEELTETQREFNRYLGELDSNTSLDFLKDEINTLNDAIENNSDLTDDQITLYKAQRDAVQDVLDKNTELRASLDAQAEEIIETTGLFDDFGKKIDELSNEQLQDFIAKNKDVAKSLNEINETFDEQAFTSLDSLNTKLKELNKRRGEIDAYSQEYKDLTKEINATQAEINTILGKGGKVSKTIIKGSIEAYEALISELKKLRDGTATTTEEFKKFDDQIAQTERSIRLLKEGADALDKVDTTVQGLDTASFTTGLNYPDPVEINKKITDQLIANKQYEANVLKAIEEGKLADVVGRTEKEIAALKQASDLEVEVARQKEEALGEVQGAILDGIQNVFNARVDNIDDEINANQSALDVILASTTASDEQKIIAQEKFAKEEARLLKEKEKREKQAFLVNQGLALAEIAINLAKTIVAINLAAATLDAAFPGSGLLYRGANIPLAISTAAIQSGIVLSQAIPAFFQGKGLDNNYQGQATVNELPGQREVRVSKDGRVELFKAGMQKTFVKRDDVIFPSISKFQESFEAPPINVKNAFTKQLTANQNTIDRIIKEKNIRSTIDPTGIERAVERAMMKYANRPQNITVKLNKSDNYKGY